MPSLGIKARPLYYQVLADAGEDGLLLSEIVERVEARCVEAGVRPFKPANAWRVLGSLVNDGLVSRASLPRSAPGLPGKGARVRYHAVPGMEGLQEVLERPQTTRVVSSIPGHITTGYNAPKDRRKPMTRLGQKIPGYIVEPKVRHPRQPVEDGTVEIPNINWFRADGLTPVRKWRWKDQAFEEARLMRASRAKVAR